MATLILVLTALAFSASTHAFSRGPPWKMCSLMIPKHHGLQSQANPAPYQIIPSKYDYLPGENLTITITSTASTPFRGFILGARPLNGDIENVVGQFVAIPTQAKGASWYASAPNVPNCVSHNNNTDKTELKFTWQAPSATVGDVIFSSAFVRNFEMFWANVSSLPVRAAKAAAIPKFEAAIQPGFSSMKLTGSCGEDKGCILYPKYCSPSNCEWVVAFKKANDKEVDFELVGISSGYISLGFSDDQLMGKDHTITCTVSKNSGFLSVQNGYNPAYNNERHRITNFSNVQLARIDDKIYCRFRRPLALSLTTVAVNKQNIGKYSQVDFSLTKPWYAFLARGKLYKGTDVLGKHTEEPVITPSMVNFLSNEISYPTAFPVLVQLHGTFMLMAWLLIAGLGIILSGHFKDILTKVACGTRLWFQLHRSLMIAVAVFTIIGIILIFVHLGEWRERAMNHGAVGLTVLIIMALQVLMGFLRPNPDSRFRRAFYFAHLISGYSLLRLAAVAYITASTMEHMPATLSYYNKIIFGCWLGFQIVWELIFRYITWRISREKQNMVVTADGTNIQMKEGDEQTDQGHRFRQILITALVLYTITLVALFAVSLAFLLIF